MAVKVLVTALGQQLIAVAKQIENKETSELVGYWLENPRTVIYQPNGDDDGGLNVNFGSYCPISDEASFSIRAEHIVAILEPRADVVEAYVSLTQPPAEADVAVEGEEPAVDPEVVTDDATDTPSA